MSLSFICMDALIASCMYPSISSLANYLLNNVFLVPKMITIKIICSPHTIKKTLKFIDSLPYSKNINFDTKTFLSETWHEDITFPYAVARCGNISCWLGTLFVQACRILRLLMAEKKLTLHNNFLCFYIHVHAFLIVSSPEHKVVLSLSSDILVFIASYVPISITTASSTWLALPQRTLYKLPTVICKNINIYSGERGNILNLFSLIMIVSY